MGGVYSPRNGGSPDIRQVKTRFGIFCVGTFALACGMVGCDQAKEAKAEPSDVSVQKREEKAIPSPAEVTGLLNHYHLQRDYEQLAPLVVPSQRSATVAFLKAMDAVIEASHRLHDVATEHFGDRVPEVLDLTRMEDNLGIFSRKFKLINQRFKGDTAVVTVQEDENVPLLRLKFVRGKEGWQCDLPPTPEGTLTYLRGLATAMGEVEKAIRSGKSVHDSVRVYYDEVLPQLMGLSRLGLDKDNAG